ncbi:MAG: sulfatase-like hydrolase/transferase [Verrucomicrobiales bacterium]|nr:sulfatase-like hydrolase/transferase [Verrucomicrobiales bacterium]
MNGGIYIKLITGVAIFTNFLATVSAQEKERPNILFIYTDDQSHRTLSCYADEGARPWVNTPNIDRLAAEGVRFSSAYGASWCVPSRASVLTGLLSHGIPGVDLKGDAEDKAKQSWATYGNAYDPEVTPMWPKNLRESGYRTAMIGKWHLGQNAGHGRLWDHSVVWDQNLPKGDWYNNQSLSIDGESAKVVPGYATDVYTDFAIDYIKKPHEKPWFLWLCYNAPHLPNTVNPDHQGKYADGEVPVPEDIFGPRPDKPKYLHDRTMFKRAADGSPRYGKRTLPKMVRGYNELVRSLDDGVGRILDTLEESGQLDDTLIIFTSDQGFAWGEQGFAWKVGPYDACLRMPLIFRYPGKVAEGKVCHQPASLLDVIPTVLRFADMPLPWKMHGHDLRPHLEKPEHDTERPMMMENFLADFGENTTPAVTGERTAQGVPWWLLLRKGKYKYIRTLVPDEIEEIYDLDSDPGELHNLALNPEHSATVEEYRELLTAELERTDAEFIDTIPAPAAPRKKTAVAPVGPRVRPASAIASIADWEKGEDLLKRIDVPPAPVLSPEEALKSFRLAPGYRAELFAAEPMVQKPIFFEFDPDGRCWVVEYQGYMRDVEGSKENDPICRVVVLEDTDADGRADKSTVFLDQLVMPRSFAFVKGGLLLQEPPNLWFCEDTDGDLKADSRRKVGTMGIVGNPQHTDNGLRYGLDNWLHCADSTKRFRWTDQGLEEQNTIKRGQFGLTFDEAGRFYTCYENRPLHGDYIPAEYLSRNPHLYKVYQRSGNDRDQFGVNVSLAPKGSPATEVWPIRVTPAVTLGAMELREDGRLETYTISSGLCCYDGHQFPEDARGNFIIPESGGHLVGRLKVSDGIAPVAERFYPAEQELLASTDERFRPVNSRVGPDGALYIADMYHGIIEHRIFIVPWLINQIRDRKLDQGNDLGRIWRIVAEDRAINRRSPNLSTADTAKLVATLSHPNGWHRLTAQRLLIERGEGVAELRNAVRFAEPFGQLHALWTLQGMNALDLETRLDAMKSGDAKVRAAAVRLSEKDPPAFAAIRNLSEDQSEAVRLQVALTMGSFFSPKSSHELAEILNRETHPLFRTAALTGLGFRELEFLQTYQGDDLKLIEWLAGCVMAEAKPARVAQLIPLLNRDDKIRDVILAAIAKSTYKKPMLLPQEPAELVALQKSGDPDVLTKIDAVLDKITWPNAPERQVTSINAPPLNPAQQKLADEGGKLYAMVCTACHQPHGRGAPGLAPPLAGSDWVSGSPDRLARVVLHGLYGPIEVNGESWNLHMPGLGAGLDDRKLAGLLTYIRRSWGNVSPSVDPEFIAEVRAETEGRTLPWRADELDQIDQGLVASQVIEPGENGEIRLPASAATIFGQRLKYRKTLDVLAPWYRVDDVAEWSVKVANPGAYQVHVLLAADALSAGDHFVLETDGSSAKGTVIDTGNYDTFQEVAAGIINLKAGTSRLILRPEGKLNKELADVRAVRLVPVEKR